LSACSSDEGQEDNSPYVDGFNPRPAEADESLVIAPPVENIRPGDDFTVCTYFENPFGDRAVDIVRARGVQSPGGHHAMMLTVPFTNYTLGEAHECNLDDMAARLVGAASGVDEYEFELPEGVAFRLEKSSVLLLQSHWINTTDKPLTGQTVFYLAIQEPDPERHVADMFTVGTDKFEVPPFQSQQVVSDCTVDKPFSAFRVTAHAHGYATRMKVEVTKSGATTPTVLWDEKWKPEFRFFPPWKLFYPDLVQFEPGDLIRVTCEYYNSTANPLRAPTEMCFGAGLYFPATGDRHCEDGIWASY
jgi:hypothetical protein